MITTPYAEKDKLTYELMKFTGKTWADSRVDAETVIGKLESGLTPEPWTVLHHPMTLWVSNHFEVHWPLASFALEGIVPGKPDPGPGPGPNPYAVVHETVPVVHNTIEVQHT